jgi:hypothetical protein
MKHKHKGRERCKEEVARVNALLDLISVKESGRTDLCQDLMFSSLKR